MKRNRISKTALGVTAAGLAMAAIALPDAEARTLKSAVGTATSSVQVYTHERFAKYVEENSDLKIKVFSLSLLNLKETPPGIRDGITEMGFVLPPYFPAEYANYNLAADTTMLVTTGERIESPGMAMAGALMEYAFFNCPDCQAEFEHQNQIYLGGGSTPAYMMLCSQPIRTLDDLKGKKFRSAANNFARWAEHFGGIAVSIPANDVYEALGQGVVDCAMMSATELSNFSLFDVTTAVNTGIPGGVFAGVATNNVNTRVWRSLTTEQRATMIKGSAFAQADFTWKFYADAKENLEAAPEKGIEIIEATPEMIAASEKFVEGDMVTTAEQYKTDYGVNDAAAKIEIMKKLIEKWKPLTEGLADDPEALATVYWEEIYSKIDPETYGMQ